MEFRWLGTFENRVETSMYEHLDRSVEVGDDGDGEVAQTKRWIVCVIRELGEKKG